MTENEQMAEITEMERIVAREAETIQVLDYWMDGIDAAVERLGACREDAIRREWDSWRRPEQGQAGAEREHQLACELVEELDAEICTLVAVRAEIVIEVVGRERKLCPVKAVLKVMTQPMGPPV